MRRTAQLTFLLRLCLTLSLVLPAVAGTIFPCPKAVSSGNGTFLVLSDVQVKAQQGNIARVQRVSLQVFQKEDLISAKDKFTSPATYWDQPRWDVVLDSVPMHNEPECPVPLITDDGQFLILLHVGPIFSGEDAIMQIYRWDHRYDHGALIKEIDLKEIWSPNKVPANPGTWTDETPEWFAEGTFEFSSDSRQLVHETRWGNIVRINLENGSVSWK